MAKWPWIERTFNFDYPAAKFPDVLERLRGTPARVEELVEGLGPDVLTRRPGEGWSIQENIGHLLDLEALIYRRVEELVSGVSELTAADMSNRRTREADHNDTDALALLAAFRTERGRLVARLEELDESDWGKAALHRRLGQQMRIVDLVSFDCEHDDYHLSRIRQLRQDLSADG